MDDFERRHLLGDEEHFLAARDNGGDYIGDRLRLARTGGPLDDERLVCLGKTGPILKRALRGMRIGEIYGTSAIYAGADYREAA